MNHMDVVPIQLPDLDLLYLRDEDGVDTPRSGSSITSGSSSRSPSKSTPKFPSPRNRTGSSRRSSRADDPTGKIYNIDNFDLISANATNIEFDKIMKKMVS